MNLQYALNERQEADFDKAKRRYDSIISGCKDDAALEEAYWGRFLCEQYVIFYQNDEDHSIPSFWNIHNEPYSESKSYKKAVECAKANGNAENAENYQRLAERIEVYKEKYRNVKKENPDGYDIFICFKDSGTDDGNFAYELYNKFGKNFNVFFSRRSLVHIKGNDYEPYIYHALQTAKALLIICSKREHLESKWVHNEWWRFMKFAKGTDKTAIPIFRSGFDESNLPDELRHCQGIRENNINFLTDLSERLSYIFQSDEGTVINDFDKKLNKVEAIWQSGNKDDADNELKRLILESSGNKTDHINAMLLQIKFLSNNYKHLNDGSVKAVLEEIKQTAMPSAKDGKRIYLNDLKRYKQYKAAVTKKKVKVGILAILTAALISGGTLATVFMMQDPLTEIYLTGNPQTIEVEYGTNLLSVMPTITTVSKKGNTDEVEMTNSMISGFDASRIGVQTVDITWEGITIRVNVNVVKYALEAPAELKYEEGKLVWTAVSRAESYTLQLGDREINGIASASYEIDSLEACTSYVIRVKAVANADEGRDSDYSPSVTLVKLAEASNLTLDGRTLSWDPIANCNQYDIYMNGARIDSSNTATYTVDAKVFVNGKNDFYVLPVGKDNIKPLESLHENENGDYEHNSEISCYKLAHVSGLSIIDGRLSWSEVSNGSMYSIYVNNQKVGESRENTYTLSASDVEAGEILVYVVCNDGCNLVSEPVADYEHNGEIQLYQLAQVSDLAFSGGKLTWTAVPNSSSYSVYVNGSRIGGSKENTYTLSASDLKTGDNAIYVISDDGCNLTNEPVSDYESNGEITVKKLASVSSISVQDGVLSWDEIEGATKYEVYLNGSCISETAVPSYEIGDSVAAEGTYQFQVKACAGFNAVSSDISTESVRIQYLSTPQELQIENGILSWKAVSGALGYAIYADDTLLQSVDADVEQFNLLGKLEKGDYSISVVATGNESDVIQSAASVTVAYSVSETVVYITNEQELKNMILDYNATYVLANDITLSGEWTPIGTTQTPFDGRFNGGGYTISGLHVTATTNGGTGLFGVVGKNGVIENLQLTDVVGNGSTYGNIGALVGKNYGVVREVIVYGTIESTGNYAGGIVGRNYGYIYTCMNYADVSGANYVGGIAGRSEIEDFNMDLHTCVNEGEVSGTSYVGGIMGQVNVGKKITIYDMVNSASVTASNLYAGGIFGYIEGDLGQTGTLESCINLGAVTAKNYAGGCFCIGSYITVVESNPTDSSKECYNDGTVKTTGGSNSGNLYTK